MSEQKVREVAEQLACDEKSLADAYHVKFCPGCNVAARILTALEAS